MISDRQKSYRQVYRSRIMGFYDGYLHIAIIYAMGAAAFYIYLQHIHNVTPLEWLTIPVTFLFTNAFEWFVHKFILHRRIPGLATLYIRHEKHHHVVYTYDDFTMRSLRETKLVLMPAYAVVLVFALDLPLAALVGKVFTTNTGLLYLATAMAFFKSSSAAFSTRPKPARAICSPC